MNGLAIKACGLGKRYSLQSIVSPIEYQTLAEKLAGAAALPWKLLRGQKGWMEHEWFWALSDVGFEVNHGEVIGIIGRNGNGKSTLLKILSKITAPTQGYAELNGRVCSLLEVGTGFHPELTGSENIYLNGSILGMTRREIQKKFDAIVQFSEVEQFLHMPVKRYSSGMRVRLAFSVAAHLDPDILIVDEVLAVGDLAFQKKCLQRMSEFASTGRTILFVSHNMPAIEMLCQRTIQLSGGRIVADGPTQQVVPQFVKSMVSADNRLHHAQTCLIDHPHRGRGYTPILERLRILDASGKPSCGLVLGSPCSFEVLLRPDNAPRGLAVCLALRSEHGQRIAVLHSRIHSRLVTDDEKNHTMVCRVPDLPLLPGEYSIDVSVGTWDSSLDSIEEAARITVLPSDYFQTGELPNAQQGVVAIHCNWSASPAATRETLERPNARSTLGLRSTPISGESQPNPNSYSVYDWR